LTVAAERLVAGAVEGWAAASLVAGGAGGGAGGLPGKIVAPEGGGRRLRGRKLLRRPFLKRGGVARGD